MTGSALMQAEHDYYEHRSITHRTPLRWPQERPLAFAIVVSIENYEMLPSDDAYLPPNLPGGFGRAPYPDFRAFSMREYGNRVGIFRLMDVLDSRGMRATAAMDAYIAARRPFIVQQCLQRDWEIAAHGLSVTRMISSRMTDAEERQYVRTAVDAVTQAGGKPPHGWHGPEYGESARTPEILAASGLRYVLDWPNDEQPYRMRTRAGPLISIPMAIDLDDVFAHWHRRIGMDRWQRAVIEAVDRLIADGAHSGRLLVLNLHPWLIGQPHRIGNLRAVLDQVCRRQEIWCATAGEIAAWYDGARARRDERS